MRGKKGSDDVLRQLENLENIKQGLNDYDSSFFETLQNERQLLLNEFNQLYNLEPELWNLKLEDKRAPSSGFFGMRGKKSDDVNDLSNDMTKDIIDKRAPSGGFFGMRGKKNDGDADDDSVNIDKRAPSGFMGMRGKKEMYDGMSSEKRAPSPGFFGMRGKKGPIVINFYNSISKLV